MLTRVATKAWAKMFGACIIAGFIVDNNEVIPIMELFIEFLGQQWMLVISWMILVAMLIMHDSRKSGTMVSPQELSKLVNQNNGVVIDIRDPKDFREGRIIDSVNIPWSRFKDGLSQLESRKNDPIILVCKFGQTTGAAGKIMMAEGFTNVNRLTGGITEWLNSRYPVVKGKG